MSLAFFTILGFSDFQHTYQKTLGTKRITLFCPPCEIIISLSPIHSSLGKVTRGRDSQQKKEPEVTHSATDLMRRVSSKMSELELRMTITKLLAGLEKSINDTRDSQSAEMKSNQAQIQKALTEMQSTLDVDALTARVNEAEDRVSDTKDKLKEWTEAEEKRESQRMDHGWRNQKISDATKGNNI